MCHLLFQHYFSFVLVLFRRELVLTKHVDDKERPCLLFLQVGACCAML